MKIKIKTLVLASIWGLLLVGLLAFQINLIFYPKPAQEQPNLIVGKAAPDFTLNAMDGKPYRLDEIAKAKPVLLLFFQSDSSTCRMEISDIDGYFNQQANPEFQVLLISEDGMGKLEAFKNELNIGLPILYDKKGAVAQKYMVNSVPANFLIGQDRVLLFSQFGSEGFNVFKIQALITFKGKKMEIQERPETPVQPEKQGNNQ